MRIAIISNLNEQKGLSVDAKILDRILSDWGHDVLCFDFRDVPRNHRCNLTIHLEMPIRRALWWSDRQWFFANPDWLKPEYKEWLPAFELIAAKTHDGYERLSKKYPRTRYVGFESEDRYTKRVVRKRAFFHSWCGSIVKGSRAVLRAWERGRLAYPHEFFVEGRVPPLEYRQAQNRCQFWIQPSAVEGFGHCIYEGLSVGAIIATTDGPPMNENPGIAFRIPARRVARQYDADLWEVTPDAVIGIVTAMWELSEAEVKELSQKARAAFEAQRIGFRTRLRELLEVE